MVFSLRDRHRITIEPRSTARRRPVTRATPRPRKAWVVATLTFAALIPAVIAAPPASAAPTFELKWGSNGSGNGQFNVPYDVASDAAGNVYVADTGNHRIQKFTSDGTFITKWGSSGSGDGQFNSAVGVATDPAGNVYVADTNNERIQKFTSEGTFITKWGSRGGGAGQFQFPRGIATDPAGNVYVAEANGNRIQKFTSSGVFIAMWGWGVHTRASAFEMCTPATLPCWPGRSGSGDGQFASAWDVDTDPAGNNVYVADSFNRRIQKFTSDGTFITKWGSSGSGDGQFDRPRGVATDPAGDVYVAESDDTLRNERIQKFTSEGTFIAKWGSFGSGDGQFDATFGVATNPAGNVYVADRRNHRIQKFVINAPDTLIDSGPLLATDDVTPTFGFSSDPSGGAFECRLYLKDETPPAFGACSGPGATHTPTSPLPAGEYTFEVRATVGGSTDPSPASRDFAVVVDLNPTFACLDELDPCTQVKVEVQELPGPGWREIHAFDTEGLDPLHDGARVRLTVAVVNNNVDSKAPLDETAVQFFDKLTGRLLAGEPVRGPIPFDDEGTPTKLEFLWDTSGYAWEDGEPVDPRTIEARFDSDLDRSDGQARVPVERDVVVQPRPVVMVHGLWSNADTWAGFENKLQLEHPRWRAFAVEGMDTGELLFRAYGGDSISKNALHLEHRVATLRNQLDAPQVDLVVHSMGGLISRYYIDTVMPMNPDGTPAVKHLFMYGTPHKGSPCADALMAYRLIDGSDPGLFATPIGQLTSRFAEVFNETYTNERGVEFSGVRGLKLVPISPGGVLVPAPTCTSPEPGDGVVTLSSANHIYDFQPFVFRGHTALHTSGDSLIGEFLKPQLAPDPDAAVAGAGGPVFMSSSRASGVAEVQPVAADGSTSQQIAAPAELEIPSGGSVDYEIPVGVALGLVTIATAPAQIASELLDPTGTVVSSVAANSPEAETLVRTHRADDPSSGNWRLRLSQAGGSPVPVFAGATIEGGSLSMDLAAVEEEAGSVKVTGTPRSDGVPATGATVDAHVIDLDGNQETVSLVDDGTAGDGQADDGTYTGEASDMEDAAAVFATATLPGGIVTASATVERTPPDPSVSPTPSESTSPTPPDPSVSPTPDPEVPPCEDDPSALCVSPGDADFEGDGQTIRIDEGDGDVVIRGNGNTIILGSGFTGTITVIGDNNTITGSEGDDHITVQGCGNMIETGPGDNTVVVNCEQGASTLARLFPVHQRFTDDAGQQVVPTNIVNAGQQVVPTNIVRGGPGDNVIRNDGGSATLSGGAGNDLLIGGPEADVLVGETGKDILRGGRGNDILRGGRGHDRIVGGRGRDMLRGGRRQDILRGGPGNDRIRTGPGNNRVDGGNGQDTCYLSKGKNKVRNCEVIR